MFPFTVTQYCKYFAAAVCGEVNVQWQSEVASGDILRLAASFFCAMLAASFSAGLEAGTVRLPSVGRCCAKLRDPMSKVAINNRDFLDMNSSSIVSFEKRVMFNALKLTIHQNLSVSLSHSRQERWHSVPDSRRSQID